MRHCCVLRTRLARQCCVLRARLPRQFCVVRARVARQCCVVRARLARQFCVVRARLARQFCVVRARLARQFCVCLEPGLLDTATYVPIASIADNALWKNPGTGMLENAYYSTKRLGYCTYGVGTEAVC